MIATLVYGGTANAAEPDIPALSNTTIDGDYPSPAGFNDETYPGIITLDSSGRIWSWDSVSNLSPIMVSDTPSPTSQVSAGDHASVWLTNNKIEGKIFHSINRETYFSCSFPNDESYIQAYASYISLYGISSSGALYRCTNNKSNVASQPINKVNLPAVRAINGGLYNTVAVTQDGHVWSWRESHGASADGSSYYSNPINPKEVQFPAGTIIRQATVGASSFAALDSTGQAWTWGANDNGQLGNGTKTDSSTPVKVVQPDGIRFTNITVSDNAPTSSVRATAAIDENGQAWAWGGNSGGLLGNGTNTDSLTPTKVANPKGVRFTEIGTGLTEEPYFTAKDSDGYVWTWGGSSIGHNTTPVGNGNSKWEPTRPLRALGFYSDSAEKPSGGTTVISCAPTTGVVVPTGLSVFGMMAAGLGLLGVLVVWLRRRLV